MRSHPERLNAWRQLGRLHSSAFTTPSSIHGQHVLERPLCLRCANGEAARGRLPATGWVCVRHRRWIRDQQCDIRAFPELLAAERHFRRVLAPRGVLADAPAMRLARDCAGVNLALDVLTERAERAGTDIPDMLLYPETVRIARLITHPAIQARLADPDRSPDRRRALLAKEIAALTARPDARKQRSTAARIEDRLRALARYTDVNWPV